MRLKVLLNDLIDKSFNCDREKIPRATPMFVANARKKKWVS
jgi:hypothetical protein